jgi:endonuclease/exonuclease/phosphatase family metal-dependent hydrolase
VLRDLNADIIGLQEVGTNNNGHEMFQLDYLARENGLNAVAGPTMRRQDKDFGNVLLTPQGARRQAPRLKCLRAEPRALSSARD